MKKVFTLLLTAMWLMVSAASAQSPAASPLSKDALLKQLLQQQPRAEKLLGIEHISSMNEMSANAVQQLPLNANAQPKQLAGAGTEDEEEQPVVLDTVELFFDEFYADPLYTPAEWVVNRNGDSVLVGGDWYIVVRNERYQFIFDFFGGAPDDPSGTYTQEDLEEWYSWCAIPAANGKTSYYKTCDLKVTANKLSENLTEYALEATVVTTLGIGGEVNGAFKIYAEHQTITPRMKLDVAILNCVVEPESDRFRLAGKNDTIEIDMTLFSDYGVEGYYTEDFIDFECSKLVYRGTEYEMMDMEGVVVTQEMTNGNIAYVAMMEILTADTCFFNVAMEAPIIPTDTVRINCNNMVIDDTYANTGTITITATDGKYSVLAGYNDYKLNSPATYAGQQAMVYVTDLMTEQEVSSMACTIDITGNALQGYNVTINMLGKDHRYYVMNLKYKIPTPVKTVDLNFETCAKSMYYIDNLGLQELQLANYNGEYSVSVDILHIDEVLMREEFDKTDLFPDQTFIVHHTADGDINVPIAKISGTIKQQHDSTLLHATVIGFDSVQYEVSMFHFIAAPTDTITYTFDAFANDEVTFTNALPDPSYSFILEAMSEDGNLMATVQVCRTNKVEGTFYNDGKFSHNDFEATNTFVQVWNETAGAYDKFAVEKGEMTVTMDEKKVITAVASLVCADGKLYNLTFKVQYERARLPFDAEEGDIEYTYTSDAIVSTNDFVESDNVLFFEILAADYSNVTSLAFYLDKLDKDIIVPEGVYPIATATNPVTIGTVHASPGMSVGGGPIQSYFSELDVFEDGIYYRDGRGYFLVDGTVTVEKIEGKMRMTIDAVNSYDLSVKLVYEGGGTGVKDIIADQQNAAKKLIMDGQLIIIRNGKTYNVLGTSIR